MDGQFPIESETYSLRFIAGFTFCFSVIKAGVISQAKGSAYIEMNHTKLMCAV